jgi:hypothetical protein
MANATPRDARAGYTIYTQAGGYISLDALNRRLGMAGYGPVSPRMLGHYRRLREAGFDHYISINRFDLARAAVPYEDLGASPRYPYASANEGVRLLLASGNRLVEASGTAELVSESGAVIRLTDPEYAAGLVEQRVQSGSQVVATFLESGWTFEGRVFDVDLVSSPPVIEIQYEHLVSLATIEHVEALSTSPFGVRLRGHESDGLTTDIVGRRLYLFFEAVEEARFLANTAGQAAVTPRYVPPAIVDRLSVASPAELLLQVPEVIKALFPFGAVGALLAAIWALPEKRKSWHEGSVAKANAAKARLDVEVRLREENLQRLQIAIDRAREDLVKQVVDAVQVRFPDAKIDRQELERLARRRLVPSLMALAAAGVTSVEQLEEPSTTPTAEVTSWP